MGFLIWANGLDRRVRNRQSAWADGTVNVSRYGPPVGKNLDEDIDEMRQRLAALESRLDDWK
jgi:hypothetical protein